MAAVGRFIHNSRHAVNQAVGTTYNLSHVTPLDEDSPGTQNSKGYLKTLLVNVNTIAGGAITLTTRITDDSAGNNTIYEGSATMATGIGVATQGSAIYDVNILWKSHTASPNLWVWSKVNAGTCTRDEIQLIWEE